MEKFAVSEVYYDDEPSDILIFRHLEGSKCSDCLIESLCDLDMYSSGSIRYPIICSNIGKFLKDPYIVSSVLTCEMSPFIAKFILKYNVNINPKRVTT